METVFYYFLKRTLDDTDEMITTNDFLGDIGDYVEIDGVGYTVSDYAMEKYNWFELATGGAY